MRPELAKVPGNERGFSLVTALLMLAAISLTAAAVMRNVAASQRMANGGRLQAQALQDAQLALRFCENQLALPPAARSVPLLDATASPAWSLPRTWTDAAHRLSAADLAGDLRPRVAPQCLMEATATAGVVTLTARGFSADFRADPVTGVQRSGAVVWLQATIHAEGSTVRWRAWQQLLTPPF